MTFVAVFVDRLYLLAMDHLISVHHEWDVVLSRLDVMVEWINMDDG